MKNLGSQSVVKLPEATQMFMFDYVKEMAVKKSCMYGEYGLYEHFFSLLLKIFLKCMVSILLCQNAIFVKEFSFID